MKIVSNVLQDIDGIQIYYIVGLLIFLVLFIYIFIRTYFLTPRAELTSIKNSIFEEDELNNNESTLKK